MPAAGPAFVFFRLFVINFSGETVLPEPRFLHERRIERKSTPLSILRDLLVFSFTWIDPSSLSLVQNNI
jgi:hypothetical protein